MLIRSKRSERSQIEHELNEFYSAEGQAKIAEGEKLLQAPIQGSLSDQVREHGALTDEQISDWEDSLHEFSPTLHALESKTTYSTYTYDPEKGEFVPNWDVERIPEPPKPKCFRPLFE